jgi:hypothetical protein
MSLPYIVLVNIIYRIYKSKYFPRLLEDPNVPIEDKNKIIELLKKPVDIGYFA